MHTAGMDLEHFRTDVKTLDAVERNLQKISEAAIRLGEQAETLCPGPEWRDIRGLGNCDGKEVLIFWRWAKRLGSN